VNVFQPGLFDPNVFQVGRVSAVASQTLPSLTQSAIGEVCKKTFQQSIFQPNIFGQCESVSGVIGDIASTLPGFTQRAQGQHGVPQPSGAYLVPVTTGVHGKIRSTLPALTQELDAHITDDELVLLLI
jgi:hypothetical protein